MKESRKNTGLRSDRTNRYLGNLHINEHGLRVTKGIQVFCSLDSLRLFEFDQIEFGVVRPLPGYTPPRVWSTLNLHKTSMCNLLATRIREPGGGRSRVYIQKDYKLLDHSIACVSNTGHTC
jgi:hypothetical protein